jgi:trehalose 6-phosphate phosphatase
MTYMLSDAGKAVLWNYLDRTTLFAFDLDGTLTPIIANPGEIALPDGVRSRLTALHQMAPVAIITGRARQDALAHLGFTPALLAGNHGAEGLPGREEREKGYVSLCRTWKEQLQATLADSYNNGVVLEDKDATLSLHYRNAKNQERAHREILHAIARLTPAPRSVTGKLVENIAPQDAPHKGDALRLIMQHLGCSRAIFVGDDETDEDVFRLRDDKILGIRVGMSPTSSSSYYLRGQEEIEALLETVLTRLKS